MAAPSMAEVVAERWGCAPGRVDPQYGAVCNSSNHTPALYGSAGCVFVADVAQALAAAGFGHVASVERERDGLRAKVNRARAVCEDPQHTVRRWIDDTRMVDVPAVLAALDGEATP